MKSSWSLAFLSFALLGNAQTSEFYSFDGVGFPTCYNVTTVHNATSVDDSESQIVLEYWYGIFD